MWKLPVGLCYKDKRYPPHTDLNCPFTLPSCQPRNGPGPFSPVAPLNNILPRASDDETVKAFIDERLEKLAQRGKGYSKGGKGNQAQPVTLQPMQVRYNDDLTIEEITTPEPPHVPPTLPPSPWTNRGHLGWCTVNMHHVTVKPHIPPFPATDAHGYAPPLPANLGAPIHVNTSSLLNASADEMANYRGNADNTLAHANASDDEMVALSTRSSEDQNIPLRTVPPRGDVMSSQNTIHYVDDVMLLTPYDGPERRFQFATTAVHHISPPYERERLTARAIQLGVTPDTLIEALYRIPDEYLNHILAPYKNDRGQSDLVHNDPMGDSQLIIPMDVTPIVPPAVFNTTQIAAIDPDPGDEALEEARAKDALQNVLTMINDLDDRLEKLNLGQRIATEEEPNHKTIPTTSVPSFDPAGYITQTNNTVAHAPIRRHHAAECRSIPESSNRIITGAITANHLQSANGSSEANKKSY
jgi:hypothetical protein